MGRFISADNWLPILVEQEEKLHFDKFKRDDVLNIGLAIIRLAANKYHGNLAVKIVEDDVVVFSHKMEGTSLENDWWMARKLNVSRLTNVSSLRAYMEIELGLRDEVWSDREGAFAACGGCVPVLMQSGATFAYIMVSGLEHNVDHQIIMDAVAEHLGVEIGSVV